VQIVVIVIWVFFVMYYIVFHCVLIIFVVARSSFRVSVSVRHYILRRLSHSSTSVNRHFGNFPTSYDYSF